MRIVLHACVAVLVAFLLLLPGSSSPLTAGALTTTELSALFWDSLADQTPARIHDDGLGAYTSNRFTPSYPNNVQLQNGSLAIRIQKNRRLIFEFKDPLREVANGPLSCREWAQVPNTGTQFPYGALPAFLTDGSGIPNNDFTTIVTTGRFASDGSYSSSYFDISTIAKGSFAYVGVSIRFDIEGQDDSYFVMPDFELWQMKTPGVVKVSRTSLTQWDVETVPASEIFARNNWPALPPTQAGLFLTAPSEKTPVRHGGGNCDLGDWYMPFGVTLTDISGK